MSTPESQRDQSGDAARAILGSFVTLVDHLIAAQTQLISSYLRIGSSVARRSRPATLTVTIRHPRSEDDQPAGTPAPSDPAPATDAIAARAYQIFVERGREPGDPVDDWRRAEAELRAVTG